MGKLNPHIYLYAFFALVIIILIAYIIFSRPDDVINIPNDKVNKDSIESLHNQLKRSEEKIQHYQHKYDSIEKIEPRIIYRTNEKIKLIFNTTDPSTLDEIIRSNWKDK